MEPRVIAEGLAFPEGPVWLGPDDVVVTEIRGQRVTRCSAGARTVLARTGGGPNGMARAADGTLYVANNGGLNVGPEGYWHADEPISGRIQRIDDDGTLAELITDFPAEEPWRPNDICFGPDGLLYFTDPHNWEDLANLRTGRIWRAARDGSALEQLAEVPLFVNGIGFTPDGSLLAAQSMSMKLLAFPWSPSGLGDPADFCALPAGFPDGFALTAAGDVYVCGSMGHVIQVFDAEGTLKRTIETGDGTEPTNCCLGDGTLTVTFSGTGQLVAFDVGEEPFSLYG